MASSRTTAKSTRCAAISIGCTRAKKLFASPLFGDDIHKLHPIIEATGSDTAMFDKNCLELLTRTGRSVAHAVMMMIPEAWQNDPQMDPGKRVSSSVPA